MIWDTVLYAGEADMLECRLTEIGDIVDHVLVVESHQTLQGESRKVEPLGLRFKPWLAKMERRLVVPPPGGAMEREDWTRERITALLFEMGAEPFDVILHGDIDEIPRREALGPDDLARTETLPVTLTMRHHIFDLGWVSRTRWCGTSVSRFHHLSDDLTLADLRHERTTARFPHRPESGWHLSWFGGPEVRQTKLHSWSHPEHIPALADIENMARTGNTGDWWEGQLSQTTTLGLADVPLWVRKGHAPDVWLPASVRADRRPGDVSP